MTKCSNQPSAEKRLQKVYVAVPHHRGRAKVSVVEGFL